MITAALYGLVVLFIGGDAFAHFTRYRYGPTVSWTIKWAEHRWPVLHIVLAVALLALGAHLEGAF